LGINISEVFAHPSVKNFGKALRFGIRNERSPDYASIIELKYAERQDQFALAISNFLRRFESNAKRYEQESGRMAFRVNDQDLEGIMSLVDRVGVKPVRAALVSYALVKEGSP